MYNNGSMLLMFIHILGGHSVESIQEPTHSKSTTI